MRTLFIIALLAFSTTLKGQDKIKNNIAEVNQIEGYYIFTDCKPVKEYQYLGTVKVTGGFSSGQYTDVLKKIVKRAHDTFPSADALILHFTSGAADHADAIKFKD